MKAPQVFDFTSYKKFLAKALEHRGKSQRGVRSRFAETIQCRSGYVTQILSGKAQLSLEQAESASRFLGLTDDESQFFLLLVIHGRAATRELRARIEKQLQQAREQRLDLQERLKVNTIREEDQLFFYSSWHYLAILTALSVPRLRSKEALAAQFRLPLRKVSDALERMVASGLVTLENGRYLPGTMRTHLGADSPMIAKHHINWRLQAIQSVERGNEASLHYSSVVSIAEKDAAALRELLTKAIEDAAALIAPSPEEKVLSLCIDLFEP